MGEARTFVDNVRWGGIVHYILLLGFVVMSVAAIVKLFRGRRRSSQSDDGES